MYVFLMIITSDADERRGILLWVPVGVFFTRHVYSFASITGSSMQVSHLIFIKLMSANFQPRFGSLTFPP